MFKAFTSTSLPLSWSMTRITTVPKKGATNLAKNYQPVIMMRVIAKLFSTCVNMELECITKLNGWCAPTQTVFCRHHKLEDLITPVDYLIAQV